MNRVAAIGAEPPIEEADSSANSAATLLTQAYQCLASRIQNRGGQLGVCFCRASGGDQRPDH